MWWALHANSSIYSSWNWRSSVRASWCRNNQSSLRHSWYAMFNARPTAGGAQFWLHLVRWHRWQQWNVISEIQILIRSFTTSPAYCWACLFLKMLGVAYERANQVRKIKGLPAYRVSNHVLGVWKNMLRVQQRSIVVFAPGYEPQWALCISAVLNVIPWLTSMRSHISSSRTPWLPTLIQ